MERVIIYLFLFSFFFSINGIAQDFNKDVFHSHQLGLEFGLGDNSAAGTEFPFGNSFGGFYRYENYIIGFRKDFFSALNIFVSGLDYRFMNGYIGYAFENKNTLWSPQLGLGYFETNYLPEKNYLNLGAEISLKGAIHIRGNGLGMRLFFLFNNKVSYVGFLINATIGWAWKKNNS